MKGVYKRFDKKLFNQNDPKSRNVVKEYFKKHDVILKDNDDKSVCRTYLLAHSERK